MAPVAGGHSSTAAGSSHVPSQFFLQEDEVTDRRAEEPAAPAALPGSPPEPRGSTSPREARAAR